MYALTAYRREVSFVGVCGVLGVLIWGRQRNYWYQQTNGRAGGGVEN